MIEVRRVIQKWVRDADAAEAVTGRDSNMVCALVRSMAKEIETAVAADVKRIKDAVADTDDVEPNADCDALILNLMDALGEENR